MCQTLKRNTVKVKDIQLGLQEVEAPSIFTEWAHEGGKVVSPMYRPPLPLGDTFGFHF